MNVRDKEIERLVKYAEALGVKVTYIKKTPASFGEADWVIDGSEIRLYTRKNTNKTDLILSLIHELGHHLWFIHKKERQPDLKFEQALDRANLSCENKKNIAPKKHRKKILEIEREGVKYWEVIVKDTNIKLPTWKINMQAEFDIFQYEYYYEYGRFPNRPLRRKKYKELKTKHKENVL